MIELLIIADDFTGALDTGAQFSSRGIDTFVVEIDHFQVEKVPKDTQVLVVDSRTRHASAEEAYDRIAKIVGTGQQLGIRLLYIKVDSTMRGNIGSSLAAAIDTWGRNAMCVFAPAFPALQRLTIDGHQYVDGEPLENTEMKNDPFTPVKSGYLPELIAYQTNILTECVDSDKLKTIDCECTSRKIVVVDAKCEADMNTIASYLYCKPQIIMSGSAGLANEIAKYLENKKIKKERFKPAKKILVLCGSLNIHSVEQVGAAIESGIDAIFLTYAQKYDSDYLTTDEGKKFVADVVKKLSTKTELILSATGDEKSPDNLIDTTGLGQNGHLIIAHNIGKLVKEIIVQSDVDTVIVFGGDTLAGLMNEMAIPALKPNSEIIPGVIVSEVYYANRTVLVVSKAGAFGNKETLISLLKKMKG